MRLLLIGGTLFLGRWIVESALARGWEVTLFHRGRRNPELFPQLRRLVGDRTSDVSSLQSGEWDAAIDTCGYYPRAVRLVSDALAGRVNHYTFISSISAYASLSRPGQDESGAVGTMADPTVETVDYETYGPLKALCEKAAMEGFPGSTLCVRPGLIVGPHDPSDRFTYWPLRMARGGEVLAPERPDVPVQIIDVRDLADWIVGAVAAGHTGTYNAVGPAQPLTMGEMLSACAAVAGTSPRLHWAPWEFLQQHEVSPYLDMPCWVPDTEENSGFSRVSAARALGDGLTFRPLAETIADTLEYGRSRPEPLRAGLTPEREVRLLALLRDYRP